MTILSKTVVSSPVSEIVVDIPSGYARLMFRVRDMLVSSDAGGGQYRLAFSSDGGTSYPNIVTDAGSLSGAPISNVGGTASPYYANGFCDLFILPGGRYGNFFSVSARNAGGSALASQGLLSTPIPNRVKLFRTDGVNITSGTFYVYGWEEA